MSYELRSTHVLFNSVTGSGFFPSTWTVTNGATIFFRFKLDLDGAVLFGQAMQPCIINRSSSTNGGTLAMLDFYVPVDGDLILAASKNFFSASWDQAGWRVEQYVNDGLWHTACAYIYADSTPSRVFIDGVELNYADEYYGTDRYALAAPTTSNGVMCNNWSSLAEYNLNGAKFADVSVWDGQLAASELAALNEGDCPLDISPSTLKSYFPAESNLADIVNGSSADPGTLTYDAKSETLVTVAGTTHTVNFPAGYASGKTVIIAGRIATGTITTPAGWTKLATWTGSGEMAVFRRVLDGSEGSSRAFTTTSAKGAWVALLFSGTESSLEQDLSQNQASPADFYFGYWGTPRRAYTMAFYSTRRTDNVVTPDAAATVASGAIETATNSASTSEVTLGYAVYPRQVVYSYYGTPFTTSGTLNAGQVMGCYAIEAGNLGNNVPYTDPDDHPEVNFRNSNLLTALPAWTGVTHIPATDGGPYDQPRRVRPRRGSPKPPPTIEDALAENALKELED